METDIKNETYSMCFTERKTSRLPVAVRVIKCVYSMNTKEHIHLMFYPPSTQDLLCSRRVSKPHPIFPMKNPTFITTFIDIYIIVLYKLHSSLNNPAACLLQRLTQCFWDLPCWKNCLSGQQGLNLLRWSGYQVLWVFVAISWAGQRCVNLPVGSAHQLCRLTENLLPAQTDTSL